MRTHKIILGLFIASLFFGSDALAVKTIIQGNSYTLSGYQDTCQPRASYANYAMSLNSAYNSNGNGSVCEALFPISLSSGQHLIKKIAFSYDASDANCRYIRGDLKVRDFETGLIEDVTYSDSGLPVRLETSSGQNGVIDSDNINFNFSSGNQSLFIEAKIWGDQGYNANHCILRDIRIHHRPIEE
jgi:hypothetical protein